MRLILPTLLSLIILPLSSIQGALTGYLKIPSIPGESQRVNHEGEIDIYGIDWGVVRTVADGSSAGGGGALVFDSVVLSKEMDKATPKLIEAVTKGQNIPEVVITLSKDSGEAHLDYLKITLTNVTVSSYNFMDEGFVDVPVSSVGLQYQQIKIVYTEFDETGAPAGDVEVTWNLVDNTP